MGKANKRGMVILFFITLIYAVAHGQQTDTLSSSQCSTVRRFIQREDHQVSEWNSEFIKHQTAYLDQLQAAESRIRTRLNKWDTGAAQKFPPSTYSKWRASVQDTAMLRRQRPATYIPGLDTLKTTVSYLQSNQLPVPISSINSRLQLLQGQFEESQAISQYVEQRKQVICQYLQHLQGAPSGVASAFSSFKTTAYYYRQQIEQLKAAINDPDKLKQKTVAALSQSPAYQSFLAKHSMLTSLFQLPSGYADTAFAKGLQTKGQVQQMIHEQAGGAGGTTNSSVDGQMQQAKNAISGMQNNSAKYGVGGQSIDIPNFEPNQQRTKTFLHRIIYGLNLDLAPSSSYLPSIATLGFTVGYKLNDKSAVGVGASYIMGLGSAWDHVQLSSEGAGLTSYMNFRIKKTWYATGGYELNRLTGFSNLSQLRTPTAWQPSALIGVEKQYRISSKVQGNIQLLFDALYHQETPQGQMFKFRVGYNF